MSEIHGHVDPRFSPVADALRESFASRGEVGAAVCVTVDGRTVVDLWGGIADRRKNDMPWSEGTAVMVFSSTKGATALCAHLLAERGDLDLDAPVARYWPEFGANGKESIPVRMLLSHQAGVPGIQAELPPDAFYRWEVMTDALAREAPWWEPGKAHGYHPVSYGWLVGEVVRRVAGKSLGTFFRDEIAGPLGLEFWIGFPEAEEHRVAGLIGAALPEEAPPLMRAMADRSSPTHKAFLNPPSLFRMKEMMSREMRACEIPAANGMATARGLAGMYQPLALAHGLPRIDRDAVARMGRVESEGPDRILLAPTRFALGFMKTMGAGTPDGVRMGPNEAAFGHVGAGGSIGFADPIARVSFGYVMNQMGAGFLLNPRGQCLIDAVYEALA